MTKVALYATALTLGLLATAGSSAALGPNSPHGVNVSVGQQLATVIQSSNIEIRDDLEETSFEYKFGKLEGDRRATAILERGEELRERAEDLRERRKELKEELREGEISATEVARKEALLHKEAEILSKDVGELKERKRSLEKKGFEVNLTDVNGSSLVSLLEDIDGLTGPGTSRLFKIFSGESTGRIEVKTNHGLSLEVKSDEEGLSREYETEGDENYSISVTQAEALDTAREALSDGNWSLKEASVEEDDGTYQFEFLLTENGSSGEAEVEVDASSNRVLKLEEEFEPGEVDHEREGERGRESESGEEESDLELEAIGTTQPGGNVTLKVLLGRRPVSNATVTVDGELVGTTDPKGEITLRLPRDGATIEARKGEAEGELELEFDDYEEEAEDENRIETSANLSNWTLTLLIEENSTPVANASVYVDGAYVGTTDTNGSIALSIEDEEEVEVLIVHDGTEAKVMYELRNGTPVMEEPAHRDDD